MKFTSPFDYFKTIIKQKFPEVTHLEINHWVDNVQPIRYDIDRIEYPPVVSWRIGTKRFKYVLNPKFKEQYHNDWLSVLSGKSRTVNVDYSNQEQVLYEIIKYTVDGKSMDEINDILSKHRNNYESY